MSKEQMALGFPSRSDFSFQNFLPMASNKDALLAVRNFPSNEGDVLVIYGPSGVGKTHILHMWAEQNGDRYLKADELREVPFSVRKVAIDNLEKASLKEQENMFYLFNHILSERGAMLVATDIPVADLDLMPELRSRLLTAPQIEIKLPDENSLQMLLIKWAADKQIQLEPNVVKYMLGQCDRSSNALQGMIEKLDRLSLEQKRKITIPLVKEAL